VCDYIVVHNCRTQHSTEQFRLSSLLASRQAPELRRCLLEGRGRVCDSSRSPLSVYNELRPVIPLRTL